MSNTFIITTSVIVIEFVVFDVTYQITYNDVIVEYQSLDFAIQVT